MAQCFFLLKQFDDVLVYLKTIEKYFSNNDNFNWNYGIALAETRDFKAAEAVLLKINNEKFKVF